MTVRVLEFEEFAERFAVEFDVAEERRPLLSSTRLVADLGFDSLDLFRVSILLDVLAEVLVPEDLDALDDFTLGDVHYYYRVQVEQTRDT